MASPATVIVADAPSTEAPAEWDGTTSWRAYLLEQFEWAHQQCRLELASDHPGAYHRVAELLRLSSNILADLRALDAAEARHA